MSFSEIVPSVPDRLVPGVGLALLLALIWTPVQVAAQGHDAHHGHAAHAHDHAGGPVDCRTLALPPWEGLSEADRELVRTVEAAIRNLDTPEAAAAADFRPALGNIPTMGVHWVNPQRMRAGFRIDEPDHLMFAPWNGSVKLVGVAYAFRDALDASVPEAFESELAHWHDHPELAGRGETLHMMHLWLVPSPYGPFAGNNFLLPFYGKGITPPDACWLDDPSTLERFERVATLLSVMEILEPGSDASGARRLAGLGGNGPVASALRASLARLDGWVEALDIAARDGDREGWDRAAARLLDELGPGEERLVEGLRSRVKGVQEPRAHH